jgi:hypothetical protein
MDRRKSAVSQERLPVSCGQPLAVLIELSLQSALGGITIQEDLRRAVKTAAKDEDNEAHDRQIPKGEPYPHTGIEGDGKPMVVGVA